MRTIITPLPLAITTVLTIALAVGPILQAAPPHSPAPTTTLPAPATKPLDAYTTALLANYDQIRKEMPGDHYVLMSLAMFHQERGNPAQARTVAARVKKDCDYPSITGLFIRHLIARTKQLIARSKLDRAKAVLELAFELLADCEEDWRNEYGAELLVLLARSGDYDGATSRTKLLTVAYYRPNALLELAITFSRAGEIDRARKLRTVVNQEDPKGVYRQTTDHLVLDILLGDKTAAKKLTADHDRPADPTSYNVREFGLEGAKAVRMAHLAAALSRARMAKVALSMARKAVAIFIKLEPISYGSHEAAEALVDVFYSNGAAHDLTALRTDPYFQKYISLSTIVRTCTTAAELRHVLAGRKRQEFDLDDRALCHVLSLLGAQATSELLFPPVTEPLRRRGFDIAPQILVTAWALDNKEHEFACPYALALASTIAKQFTTSRAPCWLDQLAWLAMAVDTANCPQQQQFTALLCRAVQPPSH